MKLTSARCGVGRSHAWPRLRAGAPQVSVSEPFGGWKTTTSPIFGSAKRLPIRLTSTRADVNFIKRVVAGPGDTIYIKGGHVYRNGKREKDAYINSTCANGDGRGCNFTTPITIPADHWFMMGDNRGESDDSRFWGPVPRKWIIGGAFATYWPPKRLGLL